MEVELLVPYQEEPDTSVLLWSVTEYGFIEVIEIP